LTEQVELPGGITHGQKIKVPMLGHAADVYSSIAGDLLLTVEVNKHHYFEIEGMNVKSTVDLTLSEALLGCMITIATAYGPLTIKVKPGVSSNDTMVLKHMGMPEFNAPDLYDEEMLKGDHIVTFNVLLPQMSTDESQDQTTAQRDKILREFLEIEQNSKDKFYAYYDELREQRKRDLE
jgi:molecular chaperone DnaJ